MTVYFIAILCIASNFIMLLMLYIIFKRQEDRTNMLINSACVQLPMLQFLIETEACHLWKIRQEIYNWQCQWVAKEEYRAAQQAKVMINNIEKLINIHENLIKGHEND